MHPTHHQPCGSHRVPTGSGPTRSRAREWVPKVSPPYGGDPQGPTRRPTPRSHPQTTSGSHPNGTHSDTPAPTPQETPMTDLRTHTTWTHRQAHLTEPRPYPVEPLARAMGLNPTAWNLTSQLVHALGFDRSHVRRYRRIGLTARAADHWATRAGLHPDIVWRGYWDDDPDA